MRDRLLWKEMVERRMGEINQKKPRCFSWHWSPQKGRNSGEKPTSFPGIGQHSAMKGNSGEKRKQSLVGIGQEKRDAS